MVQASSYTEHLVDMPARYKATSNIQLSLSSQKEEERFENHDNQVLSDLSWSRRGKVFRRSPDAYERRDINTAKQFSKLHQPICYSMGLFLCTSWGVEYKPRFAEHTALTASLTHELCVRRISLGLPPLTLFCKCGPNIKSKNTSTIEAIRQMNNPTYSSQHTITVITIKSAELMRRNIRSRGRRRHQRWCRDRTMRLGRKYIKVKRRI